MLSKRTSLSPLEQFFGIQRPDLFHDKIATLSDTVSGNSSKISCSEEAPESTDAMRNISKPSQITLVSWRNTECNVSPSRTTSKPEAPAPPPPPPPPLPLSARFTAKPQKQQAKETEDPQTLPPKSVDSAFGIEHLEKKLDMLHGMMLQLIESVSQAADGQQVLRSAQHSSTTPVEVKVQKKCRLRYSTKEL